MFLPLIFVCLFLVKTSNVDRVNAKMLLANHLQTALRPLDNLEPER